MLRDIPRGVLFAALTAVACREAPVSVAPEPPARVAAPPVAGRAAAIAHGGVGSPPDRSDGCRRAVDAALAALEKGADPVDAAVAGVMVMEDDPRFNAGTGSRVRIDGATVQMDASVMTSEGRFAAVAVIEQVKNPVAVARAVLDTPHLVLAGEGATAFARTLGMAPYDPATDEMRRATADIQAALLRNDPKLPPEWRTFDWRARWNFERSITEAGLTPGNPALPPGSDTVGVAVRAPPTAGSPRPSPPAARRSRCADASATCRSTAPGCSPAPPARLPPPASASASSRRAWRARPTASSATARAPPRPHAGQWRSSPSAARSASW
jgi:hypothetical protein